MPAAPKPLPRRRCKMPLVVGSGRWWRWWHRRSRRRRSPSLHVNSQARAYPINRCRAAKARRRQTSARAVGLLALKYCLV